MKEFHAQKIYGQWVPYTLVDADTSAEYHDNQVCRIRVYGTKKARSLPQLNLYWACCNWFAENHVSQHFNDKYKVDAQIRVETQFVDLNKSIVDLKGVFHPHYRSIAVKNLKHIEACNYFNRAFELLSDWSGVDEDTMIAEVKSRMKTR